MYINTIPSLESTKFQEERKAGEESFQCGGVRIRYALQSRTGSLGSNQDDCCVHEKLTSPDEAFFAVFDGHGKDGKRIAAFATEQLPNQLMKQIIKVRAEAPTMSMKSVHKALIDAHVATNKNLRKNGNLDDSTSGTTAISAYFHGCDNRVTIANLGDSRAVVGVQKAELLEAFPLSHDHTAYRKDERARVIASGAEVKSLDQKDGLQPVSNENITENDFYDIGFTEDLMRGYDTPRVWIPQTDRPGTAVTRSIGDEEAETIGVFAEPEMLTLDLTKDHKVIVLASDGVFEFLSNQSVIDICSKFDNPGEACNAIVQEAHELWLKYETSADDITVICIFVEEVIEREGDRAASQPNIDFV